MKTLLFFVTLLSVTLSHAQVLEARPFTELVNKIEAAKFTYKETGKLFGYNSIHSCLFVSEDIAIFKNYCWPAKEYPARGYTIITREWGVTELYEEKVPGVLIREISVDEFPVFLIPYLQAYLPDYTLDDFNGIFSELYPRYNPGCWSTNFSKYYETNIADCYPTSETVIGFDSWAQETQSIVMDESRWMDLMKRIERKLKR